MSYVTFDQLNDFDKLANEFFTGQNKLEPAAKQYTRGDLAAWYQGNIQAIEALVAGLNVEQLAYKLPGAPSGVDTSGDEEHFDTSQIVTHLAAGTAFHWWGMTRALKHERPPFPRPPEGIATTGKNKTGMGAGGWSGLTSTQLIEMLNDTSSRFLHYLETLPDDIDEHAVSRYGVFGSLTAHGWLFLAAIHSAMHLKQLREMQAQADYPVG